jgi:xanthine dehydrogenase accessory factor
LKASGIEFSSSSPGKDFSFIFNSQEEWVYQEKTGYKHFLYVVGGGHCSLALSQLMRSLGFYTKVYDDRANLVTMNENTSAHEKIHIRDYSELSEHIPAGPGNYVVLMTFGYRTDDIALRSLFGKKFKYIGVLGSESKMKTLFDSYREEGIPESELAAIKTPIGLSIKSQTPWEIAVSIAAEIIMTKNN